MIDKEELHNINYAVDNFRHFLSDSERVALDAVALNVTGLGDDKVSIHIKGCAEPSEDVRELLKDGMSALRRKLATKLLSEYRNEIYTNSCSKCGKLPKTPKARMCTWCGHSWFE
ncbi:hypothetical protein [Gynuella sunshinyii]|uniref:hypothetical protein n=1 Tax=Gynuella sunshinyii TaxID=1445505 RepID=UPI00069A4FD2|nr:hypothetical protein [Gynuella sunshinyii]